MLTHGLTERDWKLFRSRLPGWQEAYMDRLNQEYAALLNGPGDPSEKFWALEKRIRADKRNVGVQAEMSRSKMAPNIISLIQEEAIGFKDLEGFSEDFRERVKFLLGGEE